MKRYTAPGITIFAAVAILAICIPAGAQSVTLPTGDLVTGRIDPVPEGDLVVSVARLSVDGMGGEVQLNGPPGFLIDLFGDARVEGGPLTRGRGATFLPGGTTYTIQTIADYPAYFLFIGLGSSGDLENALYETKPISWGPEQGKIYDVSLSREKFAAGAATSWQYNTGPAFGILEGGDWENRQASGITERIQTPGYYLQPSNSTHQLAQVGSGGYVFLVQLYPHGQPAIVEGTGVAESTPTVLAGISTPIVAAMGLTSPAFSAEPTAFAIPTPTNPSSVPTPAASTAEDYDRTLSFGLWSLGIVLGAVLLISLRLIFRGQKPLKR